LDPSENPSATGTRIRELVLEVAADDRLSPPLIVSIADFCDEVEDAAPEALAVLRLRPRATGRPAPSWPGQAEIHLVNRWERALRRLERLAAPTVAVAEGVCSGPALEVLLTCDYRIASADLLLELRGPGDQIWPGMLVHRLANQLGVGVTRRLVLFGAKVGAERAAEIGLIDEIADDVPARLNELGRVARSATGQEFAIRRRLLLDATNTSFEDALGGHLAACDRILRRPAAEAVTS